MTDPIARITFEVTTKAALRGITENLPELGSGVGSYKVEYLNGKSEDFAASNKIKNKINETHKWLLSKMETGKTYYVEEIGKMIHKEKGLSIKTASPLLSVLARDGFVVRTGKGAYEKK